MDKRKEELLKLRSFTEDIDKDLTMILQSLQWDRKHILQHPTMVQCKYDSNHKVLHVKAEEHEQKCLLRQNGYIKDDCFLPDPMDVNSSTLIKLSTDDITHIIDNAAQTDPAFKRGMGSGGLEPWTVGRLQCAYSSDERRAIHDAVVAAAPSCHDLADLALTSAGEDDQVPKTKTRTEILAELRDMRRRRTKYRVAAKSRNYSDVLRDVIKTQMEHYNEALGETKPNKDELDANINKPTSSDRYDDTHSKDNRNEHSKEFTRHDKGTEQSRKDRSDRYRRERRYERGDSRNKGSSRERTRHHRAESDYRHRGNSPEDKLENKHDYDTYKDRSKETRHRHKSKEREYEDRRDRSYRHKEKSDKDPRPESYRRNDEEYSRTESYNKDKRKEHDRRNDEARKDLSDGERARNLLTEIKKEIGLNDDVDARDKDNRINTEFIEAYHERHYKDYVNKSRGHDRNGTDGQKDHKYRHRESEKHNVDGSAKSRHDKDSKRGHESEKAREDSYYRKKHKKSKDDSRKERQRERSSDKEVKKLRTEDKHRMYYEIYSEIDSRRNKSENK